MKSLFLIQTSQNKQTSNQDAQKKYHMHDVYARHEVGCFSHLMLMELILTLL